MFLLPALVLTLVPIIFLYLVGVSPSFRFEIYKCFMPYLFHHPSLAQSLGLTFEDRSGENFRQVTMRMKPNFVGIIRVESVKCDE